MEYQVFHTFMELGYPAALVVIFVFWGWKREERLTNRINESEEYIRTTLAELTKKSIEAMDGNSLAYKEVIHLVRELSANVETLANDPPCTNEAFRERVFRDDQKE